MTKFQINKYNEQTLFVCELKKSNKLYALTQASIEFKRIDLLLF